MSPHSVLSKTQKGAREIETRENKLDHRLRALLITVNGKSTAAAASPAAPGGPAGLKQVQVALCMHLRNLLGPDADVVTAQIEACKSLAEVRTSLGENREMLDGWLGKGKAAQFWAKADPLLP